MPCWDSRWVERHGKSVPYKHSIWDFSLLQESSSNSLCPECVWLCPYVVTSFLPSFLFKQPSQLSPTPLIKQKKTNPKGEEEEVVLASFLCLGESSCAPSLLKISPLWLGKFLGKMVMKFGIISITRRPFFFFDQSDLICLDFHTPNGHSLTNYLFIKNRVC